jgi:hypothetical protein
MRNGQPTARASGFATAILIEAHVIDARRVLFFLLPEA